MIPNPIPDQPGCLSIRNALTPKASIECPDVRSWRVFLWFEGQVFSTQILYTETPEPWLLDKLLVHFAAYPHHWRQVSPFKKS